MAKTQYFPAVLLLTALALGGCSKSEPEAASISAPVTARAPAPNDATAPAKQDSAPRTARKVVRSAELSIEVSSPAAAETQVSALVERLGGYVASSERHVSADEGAQAASRVQLSLRVPAQHLEQALRDIKRLGGGAQTEKIGSEDVTDEYIDVDARITNQKRLETQLASLLTQASKVDDALKVHQELTTVRTEIDRLEGRRRFLETETSLAKISLTIAPIQPVVAASSNELLVNLRRAATDAIDLATAIVLFGIRAGAILLTLFVMIGLPLLGIQRLLRRRKRRAAAAVSA